MQVNFGSHNFGAVGSTRTQDPGPRTQDSGPRTRTQDPGPRTQDSGPGPRTRTQDSGPGPRILSAALRFRGIWVEGGCHVVGLKPHGTPLPPAATTSQLYGQPAGAAAANIYIYIYVYSWLVASFMCSWLVLLRGPVEVLLTTGLFFCFCEVFCCFVCCHVVD